MSVASNLVSQMPSPDAHLTRRFEVPCAFAHCRFRASLQKLQGADSGVILWLNTPLVRDLTGWETKRTMSTLRAAMTGFDATPRIHPQFGAWGTTPSMTEIDLPLLSRCLALEGDGRLLLWFSHDLIGLGCPATLQLREHVAAALELRVDQVVWSTSQTHASGSYAGFSEEGGGSSLLKRGVFDAEFCAAEHQRFLAGCVDAGQRAVDTLQPVRVAAGVAHCDNISYNSRLPLATGGVKFSRDYAEGLQSGRFFDKTVSLVRFEQEDGRPLGTIFSIACHPATILDNTMVSPDYVGTARARIEESSDGAPAMFIQGFCGDVHNYYMFCGPAQARLLGNRLADAVRIGLNHLVPIRTMPLRCEWRTIELQCRSMYTKQELEHAIAIRRAFQREVDEYPHACWVGGQNVPEFYNADQKKRFAEVIMRYCEEGLRILAAGESVRNTLALTVGAVRIGDLYVVLSPGENFTETARYIREHAPHSHTMICGDTNGLFGYIGTDEEIDRGGSETDTYWKMTHRDGFRLAPAKGSAQRLAGACLGLLEKLAT